MRTLTAVMIAILFATIGNGCSSGPAPESAEPPPRDQPVDPGTGFSNIVSGAEDSVSAVPGSPDALYSYRFRQLEPTGARFTFQDRELSFYFKPTPSALYFQVENRQNAPVWIEWDRSTFYRPRGGTGKVAHAPTRWQDRYRPQPATQVGGLQRYGDYAVPMDDLLDPAGTDEQLRRPMLPEDRTAPQYEGTEFGADLVFRVEDRLRTYSFRFRVESVLPR